MCPHAVLSPPPHSIYKTQSPLSPVHTCNNLIYHHSLTRMGCCFSTQAANSLAYLSSAKVISVSGDLHEYPIPITVSEVLAVETENDQHTSQAPPPSKLFICNSDKLYFDHRIPQLNPNELLQAGQIYFVLPVSKLHYPLSASDMAAMAVRASGALLYHPSSSSAKSSGCNGNKGSPGRRQSRLRTKMKILPLVDMESDESWQHGGVAYDHDIKRFDKGTEGPQRSGSIRKMQRSASRRARFVYRSFRAKLSTIYENEGSFRADCTAK